MPTNSIFKLIDAWHAPSERGRPDISSLLPHQKLLLLSDGSLTLELELVSDATVSVDVLNMHNTNIAQDDAQYMSLQIGTMALNRTVWLKAGAQFLVFAHTLMPDNCVEAGLKKTLDGRSMEPIGKVLTDMKIFFTKEKLQIGAVTCLEAARVLSLNKSCAFAARRYILSGYDSNGGPLIKAAVVEIFNPTIVPCGQIQDDK